MSVGCFAFCACPRFFKCFISITRFSYLPVATRLLGFFKKKRGKAEGLKKEQFTLQDLGNRRDTRNLIPFSLSLSLSFPIRIVHYHVDEALLKRAAGYRGLSRFRFVSRRSLSLSKVDRDRRDSKLRRELWSCTPTKQRSSLLSSILAIPFFLFVRGNSLIALLLKSGARWRRARKRESSSCSILFSSTLTLSNARDKRSS